MPTYTQTGLELPGNGEQDGIWGDTVNDNMQIIDRLTNGVGAIALSGTTHTLTTAQGELSPGQFAVLVFGGSPSGTNTVTINPNDAQHVYIVRNTTAQSVILTQGSGGNVTVAAGKSAIVACDGAGSGAAVTDITAGFSFQAPSAALTAIAALDVTDGNFIVGNGTTWVAESGDTVLTSIGVTATAAELNVLDGITATTTELNVLDGITATTTELNYTDGVTSAIQTQLDALDTGKADKTITITAGTGLTGGGDLSENRTISPDIASQAEAEAGTASNKLMTPQRTAQAITALAVGGLVPLGRVTLTFSVFSAGFSSTEFDSSKYSSYMFVLTNVIPTTDGVNLLMRTSANGGSSFDSGASDYKYTINNNAQTGGGLSTTTSSSIQLCGHSVGSSTGEDGVSGSFILTGAGTTKRTTVTGNFGAFRNDGLYVSSFVAGARDSAAVVDGVQFFFSSGDVESGTFEMYGVLRP